MPEPIVEVHELRKTFPTTTGEEKHAVDGISFGVEPGQIYGLLGPNGAGKTTTLRMIAGLLTPTGGYVRLEGNDPQTDRESAKRCLGYLTASTGLYERLSPREVLNYFGELIGLDAAHRKRRIDELITWLDMSAFATLRCGGLSTGQKQRTNIARALMGDPPILIMDEPTLGLDVLTNRVVLDFIRAEGARGKAIILSTHYLDDAEAICDQFGLIHNGKIVGRGDLQALRAQSGKSRLSEIFLAMCGESEHVLSGVPGGNDSASTSEAGR